MAAASCPSVMLLLLLSLTLSSSVSPVMNAGGIPYEISNPPGSNPSWRGQPGKYSTNFYENVEGVVEHFDVYGEVRTKYSQVYWTRNAPIPLPPALVSRFDGKVMAITGYEVDQVTHTAPHTSSGTDKQLGGFACYPSCDASDRSVPIYNAYNHHYFGWLMGKDAEIVDLEEPKRVPNPSRTELRDLPNTHGYPTNIVFKENPGGEFRKSYHGYPSGTAQLLHSPTAWVVEPMQIDTHNREFGLTEQAGPQPSFLPKVQQGVQTDRSSGLSPLIECPCSDRISKSTRSSPQLLAAGTCKAPLASPASCFAAAAAAAPLTSTSTVSSASLPSGCSLFPAEDGFAYAATFNGNASSPAVCGASSHAPLAMRAHAHVAGMLNISLSLNGSHAIVTLAGPTDVWFGVGFDAESMEDAPYAIIIDGNGVPTERRLASHAPGTLLPPTVAVVSSSVVDGLRRLTLSRPLTAEAYSFPSSPTQLNFIAAVGSTPDLSYHAARSAVSLMLLPTADRACVCTPAVTSAISYMNRTAVSVPGDALYRCADEPRSDMLRHGDGTGRSAPNQACSVATYHGGLHCCSHEFFLTDIDQDVAIPDQTDRYFLKWRYYYQAYTPKSATAPASHRHLWHWVFLIDEAVNDYEEDNAQYGSASLGKLTATLTAADLLPLGTSWVPAEWSGITLHVVTPHFHAPNSMRAELWNEDTGELICNATARYGSPAHGPVTAVFNEADYVAIPPCIFGHQPGLQTPITLTPDTNLTAVKYFNNTFRHLGQMAQWTGLLTYNVDPF